MELYEIECELYKILNLYREKCKELKISLDDRETMLIEFLGNKGYEFSRYEECMKKMVTYRGFCLYKFEDLYNEECKLQKSSLATEQAILLGIKKATPQIMASKVMENGVGWVDYPVHEDVFINTSMHLSVAQVKELLPILQKFVDTGDI